MRVFYPIKRFFRRIKFYLSLPEMRTFWFLTPALTIIIVINFIFLPVVLAWLVFGVSLIAISLIFVNSLRLAKLNWEMKIERNQIRSIIAGLQDGLIAYDPDFKVIIFNKVAEKIFKIPAKKILGKTLTPALSKQPEYQILIQTVFPSLAPAVKPVTSPDSWPSIVEISFKSLELRVATSKITDPSGRLLGFFKVIRDQTRIKRLIKAKGEFVTIAAHQLRTPLGEIKWGLESLVEAENLTEDQKIMLEEALNIANHLLKIVADLLTTSRIEEGKFGYKFKKVDIVRFVQDILISAKPLAKEFEVKLFFEAPKEPIPLLKIDPDKLGLALSNLIDNGIRYNTPGGRLVVRIKKLKQKPFIQLSVEDTGIGIPKQDVDRLFTKFFRASNVKEIKGSGLGLYLTKNIIENHGGEIWVESILGRGTTFYFTLPTEESLIPTTEIPAIEM